MKHRYFWFIVALSLLGACAPKPAADDPLTGMWSGEWGPDATRRDPVALELRWDGAALKGTVNPGPRGLEISKASFDPQTGAIGMEFDAVANGETVHFIIEGKVEGKSLTGNWHRGSQQGDFQMTKE